MLSLSSLIAQVRTCIIENEFDKAINLLKNPIILKSSSFANEITLLGSRYHMWKSANLRGDDQMKEYNAIVLAFANVVEKIEKSEELYSEYGLSSLKQNLIEKIEHLREGEVEINGSVNVMTAYLGGLKKCQWRFFTTSYLDSEFWSSFSDSEIRHHNANLLKRIKTSSNPKSDYRRLFVIDDDIDNYINNTVNRAISYKRIGDLSMVQNFSKSIDTLKYLDQKSMEMRVSTLKNSTKTIPLLRGIRNENPLELDPRKKNIEFAIFDDFRVDVYFLDDKKRIRQVKIFTSASPNFEGILASCEDYFGNIWNSHDSLPVSTYFEKVNEYQMEHENEDIDYDSSWLLNYVGLSESDTAIASEKESVLNYLKTQERQFNNYLDIGVCTARYPLALKNLAFVKHIDAVDKDYDVAKFMQHYRQDINFVQYDIRLPKIVERLKKYELITSMVSTPSHFGLNLSYPRFNDRPGFNQALHNMCLLLNSKGLLILSFWSDWDYLKKINLYDDAAFKRIKENTPSKERIDQIIINENLPLKHIHTIENKNFNIYVYQKIIL